MNYFIFRNFTIEPFFRDLSSSFSGYGDISSIDETANAYIWFYLLPYKIDNHTIANEIANYGNLLDLVLSRLDTSKPFYLFSIQSIYRICYQTSEYELEEAIHQYNRKIYQIAENNLNVKIINITDFYKHFSEKELIDWKFYNISQMPLNPKLATYFSQWLSRQIEIAEMKRKKCIVLDLDNTLWGGILGEDGMEHIKIGEEYPGTMFHLFQEYLLELKKNGIILTVCSHNNEADILEVWEKHPHMLLHKDDFAAYRINWKNKADNIKEIAAELNIGLDSMIFVDDNPTERELVRQMLPQVIVPDFPKHPYLYPEFIKDLTDKYFSTYQITEEDLSKTRQYNENALRRESQNQFTDFESYLRSLEIELIIEPLDDFNILRIAQMTQKTNQFNLTTRRYSESEIRYFTEQGGWVYGLRAKDRFGDNGLTGLVIIEINEKKARIDTLLLSCRILGKNIETAFIHYILTRLKDSGIKEVEAHYIPTAKNLQVADFYNRIGFKSQNNEEEIKTYHLSLDKTDYTISDIYNIKEK